MQNDTEKKMVGAASDERVVNNTMRHKYRVLSELEKARMQQIKDAGLDFIGLLYEIGGKKKGETMPEEGTPHGSRELSLAATKIEEAVMWAVKHITK